jgi:hypothetical protein
MPALQNGSPRRFHRRPNGDAESDRALSRARHAPLDNGETPMPPVIKSEKSLEIITRMGLEVQPGFVVIHSVDAGTHQRIVFPSDDADEMGLALVRAAQASREMQRIATAPTLPGIIVPNGGR